MAKKKIKEEVLSTANYVVSLTLADKEYKEKGATILECLERIKPEMAKSKGILKVKRGTLSSEMMLYPFMIKRLMVNLTYRMILDKRLNLALS